jgi:hypothetical protein
VSPAAPRLTNYGDDTDSRFNQRGKADLSAGTLQRLVPLKRPAWHGKTNLTGLCKTRCPLPASPAAFDIVDAGLIKPRAMLILSATETRSLAGVVAQRSVAAPT